MEDQLPPGASSIRIRQVALCTDDIWREEQRLVSELGIAAVHRDPPNVFRMRNAVFAVGDTLLEVLGTNTWLCECVIHPLLHSVQWWIVARRVDVQCFISVLLSH